jgi:hypothetical protein
MASIPLPTEAQHDTRVDERNHPIWMQSFSYETRHALIDQDLAAGRSVTAVLLTIVTGGLIWGLISVIIAIALQ